MKTKEVLAKLTEGKSVNELARAFGHAKEGEDFNKRQDFYRKTVERLLDNPGNSRFESVIWMFQALGIDIESAIAIAANQKLQER